MSPWFRSDSLADSPSSRHWDTTSLYLDRLPPLSSDLPVIPIFLLTLRLLFMHHHVCQFTWKCPAGSKNSNLHYPETITARVTRHSERCNDCASILFLVVLLFRDSFREIFSAGTSWKCMWSSPDRGRNSLIGGDLSNILRRSCAPDHVMSRMWLEFALSSLLFLSNWIYLCQHAFLLDWILERK